jgi:hypothetical protein
MGVFIKYLVGMLADEEIEAVFGHWVNKETDFYGRKKTNAR